MIKKLIVVGTLALSASIVFITLQSYRKTNSINEASMNYTIVTIPEFKIVGIQITTDNSQGSKGFAPLWEKFYAENIRQQIPNKIDDEVVAVYTDYQGDHTKPFSYIVGCRVSKIENVPADFVARTIPETKYALFTAKGEFPQSLGKTWGDIWKSDLKRTYKIDFEVYGSRFFANEDKNKEVDVFIGV